MGWFGYFVTAFVSAFVYESARRCGAFGTTTVTIMRKTDHVDTDTVLSTRRTFQKNMLHGQYMDCFWETGITHVCDLRDVHEQSP
jgi:hypothetical protein